LEGFASFASFASQTHHLATARTNYKPFTVFPSQPTYQPTNMSQSQQINRPDAQLDVAPTPQNTPLDTQVLANRPANQGRPQVEDIGEGEEEDDDHDEPEGANPASLLAQVSCELARYPV